MMTANLILTIIGLLFLLIALVGIYVWSSKTKVTVEVPMSIETFESLSAVIKNRSSSASELRHAVEMILKRFGTITSQTVGTYKNLLESLCVHPKTDSKLILSFEKNLRVSNPSFAREIEQALAIGLAARK